MVLSSCINCIFYLGSNSWQGSFEHVYMGVDMAKSGVGMTTEIKSTQYFYWFFQVWNSGGPN